MPFRKLPNTDAQRTAALDNAFKKYEATDAAERLYRQTLQDTLVNQRTNWSSAVGKRDSTLAVQACETAQGEVARLRLEQFVSHYFQVFQLGVQRGVFERGDRTFYGLEFNQTDLPAISTHEDLIHWAQHIVDGDAARAAAKPTEPPMALPSAAEVAKALATYRIEHTDQSDTPATTDGGKDDVARMRPGIDAFIRDLWDTIEFSLRHESGPERRRKAKEWGVIYVPRPGEAPDPGVGGGSSPGGG